MKKDPLKRDLRRNLYRFNVWGMRGNIGKGHDRLGALALWKGEVIDSSNREGVEDSPPTAYLVGPSLPDEEE